MSAAESSLNRTEDETWPCAHERRIYASDNTLEDSTGAPKMKCANVALSLSVAQLVAGLGLTVLPIHTMLKLPSLATRDCPLWAAGPLLCSGIVGIIAVYSNTNYKSQHNRKPIFVLKVVSFTLSSLSGVLCLVAAAFLVLHVLLYIDRYTQCRDDPMRRQCFCSLLEGASRLYRYDSVSCLQVRSTVKGLFYSTASVSTLGGVCSLWYLTLLWSSRYVYFNAGLRRSLNPGDPLPGGGDLGGEQYSADQLEHGGHAPPPHRLVTGAARHQTYIQECTELGPPFLYSPTVA